MTKLKNSNCDKTQQIKLWQNSKTPNCDSSIVTVVTEVTVAVVIVVIVKSLKKTKKQFDNSQNRDFSENI